VTRQQVSQSGVALPNLRDPDDEVLHRVLDLLRAIELLLRLVEGGTSALIKLREDEIRREQKAANAANNV
jgi:hypothetical protein